MPSQNKLIKQGIYLTDSLFDVIIKRLNHCVRTSDTLESFLTKTKDYTMNNPLVVTGYKDDLLEIILKETNNHRFSRPAQKELTRLTIENRVGGLIVDVGDDIKESVRDIVKHGYNNNLSQDEIAENITHRVSVIKNKRARAIARTEIARTATASDYVINKERGANAFTVDCRNTACAYCKEKVLKNPEREATSKGMTGDVEFSIDDVENLPPFHPNCRCVAMFFIKEVELSNELYNRDLTSLRRIGNTNYNDSNVNPHEEFERISKKGKICYTTNDGDTHEVKVRCKKSTIVEFGDEKEIGEKLNNGECYQYDILDNKGNLKVTIYKSKNHNQFSIEHLISIYDNLNKNLISGCDEIVISNHEFKKGDSGGFVLPSNPHRVHIMGKTNSFNLEPVLIHEMAHSFDGTNNLISSSKSYQELVSRFPEKTNPYDKSDNRYFAEDFAYTIEAILMYPEHFMVRGNAKTEYLYKLLGIL